MMRLTSRHGLLLSGALGVGAAGVWWWDINTQLTRDRLVALVFTALLTAGPPVLASFLCPMTPGAQLLARIRARTFGQWVAGGCALYLTGYTIQILRSWWQAQPATAAANAVLLQTILGVIGFILVPALCLTAATWTEVEEEARQAHLVRRYQLQVLGDIQILRYTMLRVKALVERGTSRLRPQERQEIALAQRALVQGIDTTLHEIGASVRVMSGAQLPFQGLFDHEDSPELEHTMRLLERAWGLEDAAPAADQEALPIPAGTIAGQPRLLQRGRVTREVQ